MTLPRGNIILTFGNYWVGTNGSVASFNVETPYLIFEFSSSSFTPTLTLSHNYGTWTRVSESPNRWKWSCESQHISVGSEQYQDGWPAIFSSTASTPVGTLIPYNLGGGTCSIIDAGGDFSEIQSIDRIFANCTGITSFCIIPVVDGVVNNTSSSFSGCSAVIDDSALEFYNVLKEYDGIDNHSGMFTDCGSSTYLAQIPTSWGGSYVPPSTAFDTYVNSPKCSWNLDSSNTNPFYGTHTGTLNILSTGSISIYAGVSMNRSRCYNRINSFSNATSAAMYFRPCFFYMYGNKPGQNTTYQMSWLMTTSGYNGMLASNQGNTDMSGTLDPSTYGGFVYEFGTRPGSFADIMFGILITNADDLNTWTAQDFSSKPAALLFNSSFLSDAGLKYYYEE